MKILGFQLSPNQRKNKNKYHAKFDENDEIIFLTVMHYLLYFLGRSFYFGRKFKL
jgi:hypothetical protein